MIQFNSINQLNQSINLIETTLFLIAMDDSDWAIHDSNLAARWRRLANFNYFIMILILAA